MNKDQKLIFEAYTKNLINEDLDIDPADEDVDPDNVFERLEKLMRIKPELENDLKPILSQFDDVMSNIIALSSEDGKIDETDLGALLPRLSHHSLM